MTTYLQHKNSPENSPEKKITFVLVVKGPRDWSNAQYVLLRSLARRFEITGLHELLVIAPGADLQAMRRYFYGDPSLEPLHFLARFMDEQRVCNGWNCAGAGGYNLQMLLKLLAAFQVKTPAYCTLDADVYLARNCGYAGLCPGGLLLWQRENKEYHAAWWKEAGRILNHPGTENPVFGVTPALLHTQITRQLVMCLNAAYNNDLGHVLDMGRGATEYTLYWTYVLKYHNWRMYYNSAGPVIYGDCIWHRMDDEQVRSQLRLQAEKRRLPGPEYFFSVLQSNTGLDGKNFLKELELT